MTYGHADRGTEEAEEAVAVVEVHNVFVAAGSLVNLMMAAAAAAMVPVTVARLGGTDATMVEAAHLDPTSK